MCTMGAETYDCIVVLGGNIVRTDDGQFAPTTYDHSDQFGMLGGYMRIVAAAWMFVARQSETFLFSTGTSEKTKAVLGDDVPTEAHVYSEAFKRLVGELRSTHGELCGRKDPKIILEEYSQNTVGNLKESFAVIKEHHWKKVAVLSADLHIPRVQALTELISQDIPVGVTLDFLGAESTLKKLKPGLYDDFINTAHNSIEGKKRAQNEAQGLSDIREGRYVMTEYQLHQNQAADQRAGH